jgi:hypothetical protein
MSISMYDASIPVLLRGLGVLSTYLDKAEAHASENAVDPQNLINARLVADMLPFSGQIQRASDTSKGGAARLAGLEAPAFPDTETSFTELRDRVAKTVAFLKTVKPQQLDDSASRLIDLKALGIPNPVRGDAYLLSFVLPNFFFHVTTAHDILRHAGVKIGKRDYLGPLNA